jgi:hypothetical protein
MFNNELSLLMNHYLVVEDKGLQNEIIDKMTYLIELMNKNNAIQNVITKARVSI